MIASRIQRAVLTAVVHGGVVLGGALVAANPAFAQVEFDRTRDRGPGIPVSQFGAYVDRGEWLIYPFVEYYRDHDAEYSPAELGFGLDEDFRGKYRALEGLIFIAHAFSDRLAFEFEAAVITARLDKAPNDPTSVPQRIEESGLGDVEGQLRWRWTKETSERPEIFTYFETVFPLQKSKLLIGTPDWEFKLGSGLIRGFEWGTMTLRAAVEYDAAEGKGELGEVAVEYLKQLSPAWRLFLAAEGTQDEIEFIPELQLFVTPDVRLKFNSAVGLTSKATDWAPEFGVMLRLR